jgi:hypothetical protein
MPAQPAAPVAIRIIRVAEMLFFPVAGFMLLSLPPPAHGNEMLTTALIAAEAVAAVVVVVGLGRRRRWAWWLALVLAGWIVVGVFSRGVPLFRAASQGGGVAVGVAVLLGWVLLTQLVVLVALVAMGGWRHQLN